MFGGLLVVLAVAFYLPFTLLAPLSASAATIAPYTAPVSAEADLAWPSYGASAVTAVGYAGVLGSAGSTKALPMASISKLITTLVVLEKKPLTSGQSGPTITMDASDVAWYDHYLAMGGSVQPVRVGEQLTEKQLLEVTLIPSANNYAASMADWAYGSVDAFLPVANEWLDEHGMTHTTFVEASGIDKRNTSTAKDLVELGELALENPVIASIVKMESAEIPDVGTVHTTNKLLGIDGVTGLKTGTLGPNAANLLFSAEKTISGRKVTIVGVVLGGVDHDSLDVDIRRLLDSTYQGFHRVVLTKKGTSYGSYATAWGQRANVVSTNDTSVVVWGDTKVSARVDASRVTTGPRGQAAGTIEFTVGEPDQKAVTVSVPLALDRAITDPGAGWRLAHPFAL